jgi:hypothetical protein
MSANLTDFPPWRKNCGSLENIPLLTENLVLTPQPLQLGRDVFLFRLSRLINLTVPAPADPTDQRRQTNPKIPCDLALAPSARPNQTNRLVFKFLRKPSLLLHEGPLASSGPFHFPEASPALHLHPPATSDAKFLLLSFL